MVSVLESEPWLFFAELTILFFLGRVDLGQTG